MLECAECETTATGQAEIPGWGRPSQPPTVHPTERDQRGPFDCTHYTLQFPAQSTWIWCIRESQFESLLANNRFYPMSVEVNPTPGLSSYPAGGSEALHKWDDNDPFLCPRARRKPRSLRGTPAPLV